MIRKPLEEQFIGQQFIRNESPTLAKLLKKLKEDFNFQYGRTWLGKLIKKLGFRCKKKAKESILYKRADLIEWGENILRRTKEIRGKEPESKIVCTDETWPNAHHKVEKEWAELWGKANVLL